MKTYKSRWYKILINIILGFFAAAVAFFISGLFLSLKYAIIIGVIIYILYIWVIVLSNIMEIQVIDDKLIVKKGRKRKEFYLPECSIKATVHNNSPSLNIKTLDGRTEYIDCELIGLGKFEELLDDMGVTGEKAEAVKLQTIKKDK